MKNTMLFFGMRLHDNDMIFLQIPTEQKGEWKW